MAEQIGYGWFVDYDKDIKFFSRTATSAPFSISAQDSGNYIYPSLEVTEDVTQQRNRIVVRGGQKESPAVTVRIRTDGDNDTYPVVYDFSETPEIRFNNRTSGTKQRVGIENITADADADIFWNSEEKYIRFKNRPSANRNYYVKAKHFTRIIQRLANQSAVNRDGIYEFPLNDDSIITEAQATTRANVELQNFAERQYQGQFRTYRSGLKTGMVMTIQYPGEEVFFDVLIQEIELTFRGVNDKKKSQST